MASRAAPHTALDVPLAVSLIALGAALSLLLVAAVVGAFSVLGSGTDTLETPEFSFEYPESWERIEGVEFPNPQSDPELEANAVGLDPDNWVTAFTEPIGVEVTAQNVDQVVPAARDLYREMLEPRGVRFLQQVYVVREAGLPGIRLRIALKSPRGVAVEDEITTLYRGETSHTINCQNRPDRATEMQAGCDRVLDSFRTKP